MCTCCAVQLHISHLLHSRSSSEEQVPLGIRDGPSLSHDVSTQHEGKDQLVLLKETPVSV